ncbi:MAG: LamG domain-containing protein, partial [FCB group bacterium]
MKNIIIYSALLMLLTVSCHKIPDDWGVIPTENLVAYYPFNGNANDESGNKNDGTVHGATLTEDRFGNPNKAYYFNGFDNYIEVKNSESLNIVGPITICVWIKTDMMGGNWSGIVNKCQHTSQQRDGYLTFLDTTNKFSLYIDNDWYGKGATCCYGITNVNDNKWHFLVGLYDRKNIKVYLDGNFENSSICTQDMPSNTENLFIGYDFWFHVNSLTAPNYLVTYDYFKGTLDDIRIYNCALTDKEIKA